MKNSKIDELFRIKEEISDEYIEPDSNEEPPKVEEEPFLEENTILLSDLLGSAGYSVEAIRLIE